jgi:hypothetical protein
MNAASLTKYHTLKVQSWRGGSTSLTVDRGALLGVSGQAEVTAASFSCPLAGTAPGLPVHGHEQKSPLHC